MIRYSNIDGSKSVEFFDFGEMPIANAFGPKDAKVKTFPMVVDFYDDLKLVQLRQQPKNSEMFNENYAFFTGTSKNHFWEARGLDYSKN